MVQGISLKIHKPRSLVSNKSAYFMHARRHFFKNFSPWNELDFTMRKRISLRKSAPQNSNLASCFFSWWLWFALFLQYLWAFWYLHLAGPKKVSSFAKSHEPDTYYLEISVLVKSKATQVIQLNETQWMWSGDLDSKHRAHISLSKDWTVYFHWQPNDIQWLIISKYLSPPCGNLCFSSPLVYNSYSCKFVYYTFNLFL